MSHMKRYLLDHLVCVFRDDIKILPTILRTHDLGVSRGTPKP